MDEIEDGGSEPRKWVGFEPLRLIVATASHLEQRKLCLEAQGGDLGFSPLEAPGHNIAECGTGIIRRVRLGREPEKVWSGLHGCKPGV